MTVTNKEIAAGFAAAKQYLWDGASPQIFFYLPGHICMAIDKATNKRKITVNTQNACKKVIASRLNNCLTLRGWLKSQGVTITEDEIPKLQAHRHAWLDLLIKEFSE